MEYRPSRGWLMNSSRNSTTARENRSEWVSGLPPVTISGAIHRCFPMMPELVPNGDTLSLSQISTSPVDGLIKKFPLLISW